MGDRRSITGRSEAIRLNRRRRIVITNILEAITSWNAE